MKRARPILYDSYLRSGSGTGAEDDTTQQNWQGEPRRGGLSAGPHHLAPKAPPPAPQVDVLRVDAEGGVRVEGRGELMSAVKQGRDSFQSCASHKLPELFFLFVFVFFTSCLLGGFCFSQMITSFAAKEQKSLQIGTLTDFRQQWPRVALPPLCLFTCFMLLLSRRPSLSRPLETHLPPPPSPPAAYIYF